MRLWRSTLSIAASAALLLGGLGPFIAVAHAQTTTPTEGLSLQISPLPIALNGVPGSSVSTQLRVRNAGTQDETLQVRLLKVSADDNGNIHLSNPGPSDPWVNWVHFSQTVFDAPPGEWQNITMTVNLPSSAAFGYYFAVEYLRATAPTPQPGKTVARGAVATFILLNAEAPGAKRQAEIVSFSADHKIYEFLPATFTVKIRNTGNVHLIPVGNIFITRGSKQVGNVAVNAAGGNILPGSSRYFTSSWSNGFPVYVAKTDAGGNPVLDKQGQAVKSLTWDFSKANRLRFGHYTAHLAVIYDDGQRDIPLDAYLSFWVIPWRIIGAILAILALITGLVAYVIVLRRRLKKSKPGSNPRKKASS